MLHINDLTYRLGPRMLFDRTSAAIPTGARTGFVGRNGTGKTTLFRMIAGDLQPESGTLQIPNRMRLGQVDQEAPGGPTALIDFVLAADKERAALLAEAESAADPNRIAEIHTRLVDIEAHAAPSRAATILQGLGFDQDAQDRALSAFSGGWRMRVALAAVLFTRPDLLLLDEPTNYLDMEGTLWLIDYLATYPATVLIISHDRDLLDAVCDHILHLDQARLTLWRGNYDSFETQRREQQAIQLKHIKKQEEQRKHLQSFVDRFRASATKASQAQSRLKMLERMKPISAIVDTDVLPFHLPSPERPLSPPIVAMDGASTGYDAKPVLSRLSLNISNDDRIGLLGSNGNGKSTFAKLVAGRMDTLGGTLKKSSKMTVGFFAQHQVEELGDALTPYAAVAARMKDGAESRIRGKCALLGFPAAKADTPVWQLSGGEKARLMMGLAAFDGPHLLILDEPTNHLDIDSRAALIEAVNDYEGAIVIISHDRYLINACADRLWLVDGGTVKAFDGDMDDYKSLVLGRASGSTAGRKPKIDKEPSAERAPSPAKAAHQAKKQIAALDEKILKLSSLVTRIDAALVDPNAYSGTKTRPRSSPRSARSCSGRWRPRRMNGWRSPPNSRGRPDARRRPGLASMIGPTSVDLDGLADLVARHGGAERRMIAVAGPPGAGKSTIAEALAGRLNSRMPGSVAVLPMDGFHYDDRVLDERGRRARKGAPDTFDVGGLSHTLQRLKGNTEAEVAVPVFDRDLEIARAGARLIPRSVRHLVVEGNYLLLRQAPWSDLRRWLDLTVMITVPEEELRRRLSARWRSHGLSPVDIARKVEDNDLRNARLVVSASVTSDVVIDGT